MLTESGYEQLDAPIFVCDFPEEPYREGFVKGNFIFIKNNMEDKSLFAQLVTVCHEVQHVIQHELLAKKKFYGDDKEALIDFQTLERRSFGGDFYQNNYFFSRTELDAEEKGLMFARNFVISFDRPEIYNYLDNNYKSASHYDFVRIPVCNDDYEKEFAEYVYSTTWDNIIDEDLIDQYPILYKVYSDNLERRSFEDMIKEDLSSEVDFYILYNFIFCDIQMGALDNLDIDSFKK